MFYARDMDTPPTARHPALQGLGWAAAACWSASWCLPVVEDYPGWAAFWTVISAPFRGTFPLGAEDSIPQIFSALTNVVFVVLFALWSRGRSMRPTLFVKIALACLIINLYWPVQMLRDGQSGVLLVGYYLWLAAFAMLFALAVISAVSNRRTSKTPTAGTPS